MHRGAGRGAAKAPLIEPKGIIMISKFIPWIHNRSSAYQQCFLKAGIPCYIVSFLLLSLLHSITLFYHVIVNNFDS